MYLTCLLVVIVSWLYMWKSVGTSHFYWAPCFGNKKGCQCCWNFFGMNSWWAMTGSIRAVHPYSWGIHDRIPPIKMWTRYIQSPAPNCRSLGRDTLTNAHSFRNTASGRNFYKLDLIVYDEGTWIPLRVQYERVYFTDNFLRLSRTISSLSLVDSASRRPVTTTYQLVPLSPCRKTAQKEKKMGRRGNQLQVPSFSSLSLSLSLSLKNFKRALIPCPLCMPFSAKG